MEKTKTKKIKLTKEQSLILRDLKFEEKVEKIEQMFPSGQAEEVIEEFRRREEKKLHKHTSEARKKQRKKLPGLKMKELKE